MGFVHSRCQLGLFLGSYPLDSRGDFRSIIELGEFVLLWAIVLHVLLDVLPHIAEAFPLVIPCALIMHIAACPLHGMRPGTVCRQPEHRKPGVACSPRCEGFRFMHTGVSRHYRDARNRASRVRGVQQAQESPQPPSVLPRTEAIEPLARGAMQRPRARGLATENRTRRSLRPRSRRRH